MTGVIWLIQLVHYPSFIWIESKDFIKFHKLHTRTMSILVGPAMILELMVAIFLAKSFAFYWICHVVLIALIWFFTFRVSVPIHNRLEDGKQLDLIQSLIKTNWPRTLIWTLKSGCLIYFQLMGLG
jgi:hypothetical protein